MLKQNFSVSLLIIIVISSLGSGLARRLSPPPFPPMDGVVSPASPSPPAKSTTSQPPPFRPSPSGAGNNITLKTLGAGIGIGGATVLVFVGIIVFWCKSRKTRVGMHGEDGDGPSTSKSGIFLEKQISLPQVKSEKGGPSSGQLLSGSSFAFGKTAFSYPDLESATGNFANNNLLGEGGFGCVHKGILPDGKEVAVKQLKEGSHQGEREFQAEVETISRVHHKHLVSLVGFCWSGAKRLLVYTYVPNKTLEFHLHGKEQPTMNWPTRMKIALGSAKALAYLHDDCQPKIIHRDIKASNILLDDNFQPKVGDFGLAKLYDGDDDNVTHISTRVMGSFGYLAPEYAQTGRLTDKSDVFSFGVVLLELISGRRPINKKELYLDYDNIVDWARPLLRKALEDLNVATVADPRLQSNYDRVEMFRMVACACVCVRIWARIRPKMSQIMLALEGKISFDELNQGVTPGDSAFAYYGSLDDQKSYKENLEIFRKMVLEGRAKNEVQPGNQEGGQVESEVPG